MDGKDILIFFFGVSPSLLSLFLDIFGELVLHSNLIVDLSEVML